MLAEFFITPDALCESDEMLLELQQCLFPFGNASVALICQLGEKHWENAVVQKIVRIQDKNHREKAMDLFKLILSEIAVTRPAEKPINTDEESWIQAAKKSNEDLCNDGIVVSKSVSEATDACTTSANFVRREFWRPYCNPRRVGRDLKDQATALRSFCAFAEWMVVRLPQVRGGCDDEIVTVRQIIKMANTLPTGYKKSDIEFQFPLDSRAKDSSRQVFQNVKSELSEVLVPNVNLRVTMLAKENFVNPRNSRWRIHLFLFSGFSQKSSMAFDNEPCRSW